MFKFRKLINASTGQRYYISKASIATDEYDWSENGGNAFTIDLQPLGSEERLRPCSI